MGLIEFIRESNRIEGIYEVKKREIDAHATLLGANTLNLVLVREFVWIVAEALIRDKIGMNVRIGGHDLRGGPHVTEQLDSLLVQVNEQLVTPLVVHRDYEHIHPFMDGNGRSGRAIWAWQMLRLERDPFARPFLQEWYYQTLNEAWAQKKKVTP